MMDLTGDKYGKLTVLSYHGKNKRNEKLWLCICECGNEIVVLAKSLRTGNTKSCGCIIKLQSKKNIKQAHKHNTKHGMHATRFYSIWQNMKHRCYYSKNPKYHLYGGRGIKVCDEWQTFEGFKKDMIEIYELHVWEHSEENTTLERLNPNGNYEPANCTWATRSEQENNKRSNKKYEYKGSLFTMTDLANYTGFNRDTLHSRINRRYWSVERAVETPIDAKMRNKNAKK